MKIKQFVQKIEEEQINKVKKNIPSISIGDIIKLNLILQETSFTENEKNPDNEKKTKQRVQSSQGVVVSRRGSGLNTTIKIRRTSKKILIDQIFPLYSPFIQSIKIVQEGTLRKKRKK
uniref:Ribosomal protein L19 n=1 Tax=Scotinosphaera sp. NIES-154 TaxID=2249731 RepID=A0A2Z4MAD1_9CHLO|nr:ribosomal protein L19 [Scotinosphaera sp. NIES-154]